MGSFANFPARGRWALLVALTVACSSHTLLPLPDAAVIQPSSIEATSDTVAIPPFGSRQLVFHVRGLQGEAVPGAVMHFAIVDDPNTPGSGGAQLSFPSAISDDDGAVTLQVIAGQGLSKEKPLAFKVRASVGDAPALDIPIFVTSVALASVEIVPVILDQSPLHPVAKIRIYFYDDTSCSNVSMADPAPPLRGMRTVTPATFTNVVTSGVHAAVGQAVDSQGSVVSEGCADVFGASLSAQQLTRVLLPLARLYPSPEGRFVAVSQFSFGSSLPGSESVQQTWSELSSDACDPARLWLDCTIDALSGSSAEDPLDCQPVDGGEGPLGALLTARRAVTDASSACADRLNLDARVYALFAASLDAWQLTELPHELGQALTGLTVESTLTVTAAGASNVFNIDHQLTALDLPGAVIHSSIPMSALAAPAPEAEFASGVSLAGQLNISTLPAHPHGFTLELGSATRFTFAASSLAPRLGVQTTDASAFVEALVNLATRDDSGTVLRGCDALDSLLCAEVEQAPGCVNVACRAGLRALAQRLDTSFSALDGQDLDFVLSGSAPMVDRDGDGHADALGSTSYDLGGPGVWSAIFKNRSGSASVYGSWTAERAATPSTAPSP
jgi:hypothetical protein